MKTLILTLFALVPLAANDSVVVSEAPLPEGFTEPVELDTVFVREQPAYRAVQGRGFRDCFRHISRHGIPMTAPVVMTMDGEDGKMEHMRFLYPDTSAGPAEVPDSEKVEVVNIPAKTFLVTTVKGRVGEDRRAFLVNKLKAEAKNRGYLITGPVEVLGYNSPWIAPRKQTWEVQLPVFKKPVQVDESE